MEFFIDKMIHYNENTKPNEIKSHTQKLIETKIQAIQPTHKQKLKQTTNQQKKIYSQHMQNQMNFKS